MELKWAVAAMTEILSAALCIWLAAIFIKWLSSLDWTFESASRCADRYVYFIQYLRPYKKVLKPDFKSLEF